MTDPRSLSDALEDFVQEWATKNGGMLIGFVAFVEYVNANGEIRSSIGPPDDQATYRSIGYSSYLDEWYRDDAHNEMYAGAHKPDEDEED